MNNLSLNDLISDILDIVNEKSGDRIYSDEPIIKRASEIEKPKVPAKIKEMRRIAYSREAHWKTSAWLFFQQGAFMADYTDDYDYNDFFTMFSPTYSDLDTERLRGYFSWRTKFRKGESPPAPPPFLQLYAQEIINLIGVSSAEEGFELLIRLRREYPDSTYVIDGLLSDYVIYYQLPEEYYCRCPEFERDKYLLSLIDCSEPHDDSLYEAICALSSYDIQNSKFVGKYPLEYKKAIVRVIRSLSEFQEKHRKKSLCEALFGKRNETCRRIFEYMNFYEKETCKRITSITINPVRSYRFNGNGFLICSQYENSRKSQKLSLIAKEIDRLMREAYDFKYKLKAQELPKTTVNIIEDAIKSIIPRKDCAAKKEAMEIVIDVSKLSKIRVDADIVRDKLIVEEEEYSFSETAADIPEETASLPEENGSLLTTSEKNFLQALLTGSDIKTCFSETGILPSVLADEINEKLFDIFADNVIDFVDDAPCISEDYIDDIKNIVEKGEL